MVHNERISQISVANFTSWINHLKSVTITNVTYFVGIELSIEIRNNIGGNVN